MALSGCSGAAAPGVVAAPGNVTAAPSASAQMHTDMAAGMESMIHIEKDGIHSPVALAPGAMVTVMNMDTVAHSVISDDTTSFNLSIPAGGVASFKAPAQAGEYPFTSGTAARMHGVLKIVSGAPEASAAATASAPSEAAKMVCADEAKQTVKTIVGTTDLPVPRDSWDGSNYTCSYPLASGEFVMTVTEAADDAGAVAFAAQLATTLAATPITGLSNLGLPGYRSGDGSVVFAKDNMTLHVDATALTGAVGPEKISPSDFAYQMATTILGCWTAHH